MKLKYRLRSITLFVSMCVSIAAACFCVLLMADEYYTARNKLEIYTNEYQGWEACRITEPTYFQANAEAVNTCKSNLEKAKDNFWANLTKNKLIAMFIFAGLGSAITGYLAVWSVWFAGTGIYRFFQWIKNCFQRKSIKIGHNPIKDALKKLEEEKDILREVEEIEYNIQESTESRDKSLVEDEDKSREEELLEEIEMLRNEVYSMRAEIEKLSENQGENDNTPKYKRRI